MLLDEDDNKSILKEAGHTCWYPVHGEPWPSARRSAMTADKSRRAILVYAVLAVRTIALSAPTALAANAEGASHHSRPWPIHNGRNYQPTEDELKALHLEDVTPDQAREIDRLYDQLLAGREKVRAPRENGR
jgi:hypothetical protein